MWCEMIEPDRKVWLLLNINTRLTGGDLMIFIALVKLSDIIWRYYFKKRKQHTHTLIHKIPLLEVAEFWSALDLSLVLCPVNVQKCICVCEFELMPKTPFLLFWLNHHEIGCSIDKFLRRMRANRKIFSLV